MALGEFDIIERFFTRQQVRNPHTRLGVGDDCALLEVPRSHELAVTTDTLVEKVHFFSRVDPKALGHKALAVNLSDLAAMGAQPLWASLALTLPEADEQWLALFSRGFLELAARYGVELIGGDTTRGPLAVTVQALGIVPKGKALTRSAAKAGDIVYVTGFLGEAGLGLRIERGYLCKNGDAALDRFHRPLPRIEAGVGLRGLAGACIDISDGLAADLGHILDASAVGARIEWEKLPLSSAVRSYIRNTGDWRLPLTAGDDYELCFTVPPEKKSALESQAKQLGVLCSAIGVIEGEEGLRLLKAGSVIELAPAGYEHFSPGNES